MSSTCWIPSASTSYDDSSLIASASYDTTARISSISDGTATSLASLQLHSAAVSSIAVNASGTYLITASWDKLVGLWSTVIPSEDEVPLSAFATAEPSRKRRRMAGAEAASTIVDTAKRKGPTSVLKSHTNRVTRALFSPADDGKAYSVGWDSTLRSWDLEIGLCTNTTVSLSQIIFLVLYAQKYDLDIPGANNV